MTALRLWEKRNVCDYKKPSYLLPPIQKFLEQDALWEPKPSYLDGLQNTCSSQLIEHQSAVKEPILLFGVCLDAPEIKCNLHLIYRYASQRKQNVPTEEIMSL